MLYPQATLLLSVSNYSLTKLTSLCRNDITSRSAMPSAASRTVQREILRSAITWIFNVFPLLVFDFSYFKYFICARRNSSLHIPMHAQILIQRNLTQLHNAHIHKRTAVICKYCQLQCSNFIIYWTVETFTICEEKLGSPSVRKNRKLERRHIQM